MLTKFGDGTTGKEGVLGFEEGVGTCDKKLIQFTGWKQGT